MKSKRDLLWIELFRSMGILIVVLVHVIDLTYPVAHKHTVWGVGFNIFVRCVVPAFLMVSGFLLGRSAGKSATLVSVKQFFKNKLHSLIIPFLAWNLIYMLLFNMAFNKPIFSLNTLWMLFTGYFHLYFVFVLLQLFLVHQMLARYMSPRLRTRLLVASALLTLGFYAGSELLLWNQGADNHFFEWNFGKCFVAWALFFYWGLWLGSRPWSMDWLHKYLWLLVLMTLLGFGLYFFEVRYEINRLGQDARQYFLLSGLFYQFCAGTLVLLLCQRWTAAGGQGAVTQYLVAQGGKTMGIYLSHLALIILSNKVYMGMDLPQSAWVKTPVLVLSGWYGAVGLMAILGNKRLGQVGAVLFGVRGRA